MSNVEIIRNYFKEFFSGKARHSEVRKLLTNDFTFHDPLMTASSAEDYVQQLVGLGDELEMYADVRAIVGEGEVVAALIGFSGPFGIITYAQWFQMRDGKIAKLDAIYDPRPFLDKGKKD